MVNERVVVTFPVTWLESRGEGHCQSFLPVGEKSLR